MCIHFISMYLWSQIWSQDLNLQILEKVSQRELLSKQHRVICFSTSLWAGNLCSQICCADLNSLNVTMSQPRKAFKQSYLSDILTELMVCLTFSSGSEGGTGVSGLSGSAVLSFFLSLFLSFPFPVPGSPDFGRRGTKGMLKSKQMR